MFKEKPQSSASWINGGFFVFNSKIFDFIKDDKTMFRKLTFRKTSKKKGITSLQTREILADMDTLRDKKYLNDLYKKKT